MSESPERIYIDQRVAPTMPTEPNQLKQNNGIKIIEYVRSDVVAKLLNNEREQSLQILGQERVVQVQVYDLQLGQLMALTSHGRVFVSDNTRVADSGSWRQIEGPEL